MEISSEVVIFAIIIISVVLFTYRDRIKQIVVNWERREISLITNNDRKDESTEPKANINQGGVINIESYMDDNDGEAVKESPEFLSDDFLEDFLSDTLSSVTANDKFSFIDRTSGEDEE